MQALLRNYGFELKEEGGRRVVEVTLKQVLQLALQRNLSIKAVRFGESVAESALRAARDRLNGKVTSTVDYTRNQFPTLSFDNNYPLSLGGTDALTLSSEYRKPTESGIEYALKYSEKRQRPLANSVATDGSDPAGTQQGQWLDTSAVTGSVNIPIGQDFGSEYNNIPVRQSEAGLAGSQITTRQRELELVAATASTYWDLVAALENERVQQEAVKLSEQLLQDNRQRLQAGVLSPFDVQVTETQLARERQSLVTARATVLRIEDLARALLNLQVINFEVRPMDRPRVHDVQLDYPKLLERVYASSQDVKQLENQLLSNSLSMELARNKDRTNLDLSLFYTFQGYSSDAFGGVSGFSQTELDNYGAALTWTLPLFDVVTQETIRQRTLERQQLELQLDSLKSDLNVRLQGAIRQINVAKDQAETSRIASQLAEEQLKNEIERFKVGESTSFQVSQSQQDAAQAQVQEILARLGFERNYLDLLVLTGDIYRQYGLDSRAP